ncbi:hypothetical protein [Ktedonospora formicarum]|uniref:Uncharacterized protein n=1 Tax=Ktedonospora formicarum TaxID=2778364 RepID=A0A8J3IAB0_9CHLR|nr:hypothetical protein [Ktedonospora formicarum]GHO51501.1 hypothetical protein KSX_96640 [Ktedonospora formicarum]
MSVSEKALQQAQARMQAYQASLEAEKQARAAREAARDEWLARVQAMRERIASGDPAELPPSFDSIFAENMVRTKEAEKQAQRERNASPYAFTGQELPQPPHVVAAWRQQYFAEHNAAYAEIAPPSEEEQA